MADVELPLDSVEKNYVVTTTLDGITYAFIMRWNPGRPPVLKGSWYFDLLDANGDRIASGVRIVLGVLLGHRYKTDPRYPRGALFASDLANSGQDAGRDDLGTRVKIYYTPEADMEA